MTPSDDTNFPAQSQNRAFSEQSRTRTSDDLLPPVEPPSAGFLLQLFVLPAVIVVVIVAVWLLFGVIAKRSVAQPEDLVAGLESGPREARWQRASEVADLLRDPRQEELRNSEKAAAQMAELLNREIENATGSGGMDEREVTLRYFLARALGEFHVTTGLDALIHAARTDRDERELIVRRGAIQAMAILSQQLRENPDLASPADKAKLEEALLELSREEEVLVRSEAAFALGRLASPASLERLKVLVDDHHADTRYNAALALADQGHEEAAPTLAEMLDPAEMTSVQEETGEQARVYKRSMIMTNALSAVEKLHAARPSADYSAIEHSLEAIAQSTADELKAAKINWRVQDEAKRVLELLRG